MSRPIDLPSLLIGGLLALLVVCLVAAAPVLDPGTHGRFAIATGTGHAFVLDTATGQAWARNHSGLQKFFEPKLDLEAYRRAQ